MNYAKYIQRKLSGKESSLRVSMPPEMQTKELRVTTTAATADLTPTADPLDDASGLAEPSGNGYARTAHTSWNAASTRAIDNNGVITFPQASGAWGTITHYAIMDANTAGNMLAHGSLATSKSVVNGNTPSIAATEISVTFSTGGFSDFLALELLDHVFGNGVYTGPTIYVALSTTIPTDSGNVTEPSGNAYARKAHATWDAAAVGATENTGVITFATPSGSWGLCVFAALYDAPTAGNYIARGDITDQTPDDGDTVRFNDGDLDITLD
jgi:hypothetical protein